MRSFLFIYLFSYLPSNFLRCFPCSHAAPCLKPAAVDYLVVYSENITVWKAQRLGSVSGLIESTMLDSHLGFVLWMLVWISFHVILHHWGWIEQTHAHTNTSSNCLIQRLPMQYVKVTPEEQAPPTPHKTKLKRFYESFKIFRYNHLNASFHKHKIIFDSWKKCFCYKFSQAVFDYTLIVYVENNVLFYLCK